jgi:hypothetical protein
MELNHVKALTVTGGAVGTITLCVGAAFSASIITTVALGALAVLAMALTAAACIAALNSDSNTKAKFWQNCKQATLITIPGTITYIATIMFQAIVQAAATVVFGKIFDKCMGGKNQ